MTAATAAHPPSSTVSLARAAGLIGASVLLLNVGFYVLSGMYFDSHTIYIVGAGDKPAYSAEDMTHIRLAFLLFSGIVGGAAIAAAAAPRAVGHLIALLMGLGSFVAGCVAIARGMPNVLPAALLILGALMPYLTYRSLGRSRPSWSFLVAICAVYAVVLFFGAPTVHRLLGIGLWTTLILPGLNIVACLSLVNIRANYRE